MNVDVSKLKEKFESHKPCDSKEIYETKSKPQIRTNVDVSKLKEKFESQPDLKEIIEPIDLCIKNFRAHMDNPQSPEFKNSYELLTELFKQQINDPLIQKNLCMKLFDGEWSYYKKIFQAIKKYHVAEKKVVDLSKIPIIKIVLEFRTYEMQRIFNASKSKAFEQLEDMRKNMLEHSNGKTEYEKINDFFDKERMYLENAIPFYCGSNTPTSDIDVSIIVKDKNDKPVNDNIVATLIISNCNKHYRNAYRNEPGRVYDVNFYTPLFDRNQILKDLNNELKESLFKHQAIMALVQLKRYMPETEWTKLKKNFNNNTLIAKAEEKFDELEKNINKDIPREKAENLIYVEKLQIVCDLECKFELESDINKKQELKVKLTKAKSEALYFANETYVTIASQEAYVTRLQGNGENSDISDIILEEKHIAQIEQLANFFRELTSVNNADDLKNVFIEKSKYLFRAFWIDRYNNTESFNAAKALMTVRKNPQLYDPQLIRLSLEFNNEDIIDKNSVAQKVTDFAISFMSKPIE